MNNYPHELFSSYNKARFLSTSPIIVVRYLTGWYKILYIASALGCLLSIILYVSCLLSSSSLYMYFFIALLVFSFFLFWGNSKGRKNFMTSRYGEYDDYVVPAGICDRARDTYIIFSDDLKKRGVTKIDIEKSLRAEEITRPNESIPNTTLDKLGTIFISVALSIATMIYKDFDDLQSLLAIFFIMALLINLKMIASLFPSKFQNLKEYYYSLNFYKTINLDDD